MSLQDTNVDIAVIGAGIAGASVAAELAESGLRVRVFEREAAPGYHTTGRSAALFTCSYGPPVIRALSRASAQAFATTRGANGQALLHPRGVFYLVRSDQHEGQAALIAEAGTALRDIDVTEAQERLPLLRPGYAAAVLEEEGASDIDVDALLQLCLRRLRSAGGSAATGAEVLAMTPSGDGWQIETPQGRTHADVVINAAGAWADHLAEMAGVGLIGLVPKRRTALLVDPPSGMVPHGWPMAVDVDETFYVKPDAGMLLLSPADETPSAPCDAQPEDIDVAIAVDRVERALDLQVRHVRHKWAGLRSFVADKQPVVGFAPDARGFFWLAGQGGYGIQTAPALARTAAALVQGKPVPDDIAAQGVTAATLSPDRAGLT